MNQTERWGRGGLCTLALWFCWGCTHAMAGEAPVGAAPIGAAAAAANIIVVTLDGMRWQEVFGGFDPMLATEPSGGVRNPIPLRDAFARDSAEESRAAILPFFWNVVAKRGQVFGDRGVKNVGRV